MRPIASPVTVRKGGRFTSSQNKSPGVTDVMDAELVQRSEAIRERLTQLQDSL
ncbi:hypothetical protein V7x_46530 [Crateriforma conspicua]|uniref:Uncharacterized protein n=1 Tax=Crateriforma conspicua TaxID=2527996 RepID=A0A5C6FQZ4_9PLAN|nr:hypothetical protein Mal65_08330 [Crateriforma conspicua]TWT72044.1 hypothetical protein Pan14r_43610 [Crateriforma conspicua]TWU62916.1 hypothetical protein V7x_46530 [Crateriforma conspicua]